MSQNSEDNLFNNPDPVGDKKKESPISGLFAKLKAKGAELKGHKQEFQMDKKSISDYKDSLVPGQNDRVAEQNNIKKESNSSLPTNDSTNPQPARDAKKAAVKEKVVISSKKWRAPKILKTNLIRGEVTTFIDWQKNFLVLGASFLLAVLIIVVVYVGLVFWEIKEIEKAQELDDELRVLSQSIIKTEEEIKSVDIFESKLALANTLLDNHIRWTKYITFLEENLLQNVYLTSGINTEVNSDYSLSLKGGSYSDIEEQIKVFKRNESVKDVWVKSGKLADAQKDELLINRGVNFSLNFELVNNFLKN